MLIYSFETEMFDNYKMFFYASLIKKAAFQPPKNSDVIPRFYYIVPVMVIIATPGVTEYAPVVAS